MHRYKGHAVRKNVALAFGPKVLHELGESTDLLLPETERERSANDLWTVTDFEHRVESHALIAY